MESISCFVNISVHCCSEVVLITSHICQDSGRTSSDPTNGSSSCCWGAFWKHLGTLLKSKKFQSLGILSFCWASYCLLLGFCWWKMLIPFLEVHIIQPSFKEQCPVETDGKDSVQLQEAMKSHKVFSHKKWFMTFYDWWVSDSWMIYPCATMVSQSDIYFVVSIYAFEC